MLFDQAQRGFEAVLICRVEDRQCGIADQAPSRGIDSHRQVRVGYVLDTYNDLHADSDIPFVDRGRLS
jgi:hypothetical protein